MHHGLTIADLGDRTLILKVDSLIGQPLQRVEPLGVLPCRRIATVHPDKNDPSGWRRNFERRKISGELLRRVGALERGGFPARAKRQGSTGCLATHRSAQQEQQTGKCDILEMMRHQNRLFTCSYTTQRDQSAEEL